MDKDRVTAADIETLINEVQKIKPGESVIATLETSISRTSYGESKVKKRVIRDQDSDSKMINFSSIVPIEGEGIKGEAIIEAFQNGRKSTGKKESFSLKRTFFKAIDKVIETANDIRLNTSRIVYKYDDFGRVYIICKGKRFYLNKEKTYCITEDGLYAKIEIHEDGNVNIEYIDSEEAVYDTNFIKFSYLYISPQAEKKGEELRSEEEDRMLEEFIRNNPLPEYMPNMQYESNNIIDLDSYREIREDEGPRR